MPEMHWGQRCHQIWENPQGTTNNPWILHQKKDVHGVLKTFTKPMDGYYGTDVSYTNVPMGFDWYQKNIEAIENCRRGLHTDTHMWLDQWLFMY
jgi:hypothetical protein